MKEARIAVGEELCDWLAYRAATEDMTLEALVSGLLVSETGERYVLPDGRHFPFRAGTDRGCEPLLSPGAVRHQQET